MLAPREALAAMRRIIGKGIGSQSFLRNFIFELRARVRAMIRGTRLPPGSLRPLQHSFSADRLFFIKRAEKLGPIFKVNLSPDHVFTTCVLGHERAMRLVAANEDRLPIETINAKHLFPIGLLRGMAGKTHETYRRLFIQAMQATPLALHRHDSERIIRDGVATLARLSSSVAGDAVRDQLRQMTMRIMFRVLFGVREGTSAFSELESSYRRFGPSPLVYLNQYDHTSAFAQITGKLKEVARDLQLGTNEEYPACFLQHLVKCGALDETVLGNLAYLFEFSHFDLYSLWHWILILLATHTEITFSYDSKRTPAARRQFAEAIVLETLRMEQSEYLHRRVTDDIVFDGFLIPAGTRLRVCIWEGHKDPTAFPNPFTFDPSRFVGKKHGRDKFAPFGLGQHHCIGANLVVGLSTLFVQRLIDGYKLAATEIGPPHHGAFHWEPNPASTIQLTSRTRQR